MFDLDGLVIRLLDLPSTCLFGFNRRFGPRGGESDPGTCPEIA